MKIIANFTHTTTKNNNIIHAHSIPSSKTIPVLMTPIIAFYIGQKKDNALEKLISAMQSANVPIPQVLRNEPDCKAGLDQASEEKVRVAINNAFKNGIINEKKEKSYYKG